MSMLKNLIKAGVPEELRNDAMASLRASHRQFKGLIWAKWKVRLFKAKKIADMMRWEDERLVDRFPEYSHWDIAPVQHITAYGDNVLWEETPAGGRAKPGIWLNQEESSAEFLEAVLHNYWFKGHHPRSYKAKKAWYRRNGGEYLAWERGVELFPEEHRLKIWEANGVTVLNHGAAWQVITRFTRCGHELNNVFNASEGYRQGWFPIQGYELRAPVSWTPFISP